MTVKRIITLLTLFLLNTVILVTAITRQEFNPLGGNINKSETNYQILSVEEKNKIPILIYHNLTYDSSKWNDVTISPDKFREEMISLKKLGFTTIHFKDYIEYREKRKKLPRNPIIITFDDGYYSNYKYAYPILKDLNMKATISVIGWSVGRQYNKDNITPIARHFTWAQAKEMYDSGYIDIQNHSYDLHDLNSITKGTEKSQYETQAEYERRFREDTLKQKKLIESNVGNEVIVYTYPYGIYNETNEKILKELGFKVTLTTESGISDLDNGLNILKRINMSGIESKELINQILGFQNRNDITSNK
ncbi:MAG TPA: polysaccharide deacetylase family protein [Sedimentibacter sp.]|nr:polysaccharide deacetylase family protein [Sedimentibacter sp.]